MIVRRISVADLSAPVEDTVGQLAEDALQRTGTVVRELDGLRGIAIVLVLFVHFWPITGPLSKHHHIASMGWIGVDLFFVISGFLITGILLSSRCRERYFLNFYARRALRILPLYFTFLGFVFLAIPISQGGSLLMSPFLEAAGSPLWYLCFLTNFRESLVGVEVPPIIRPLWSLAIEEHFYLLFPFVAFYFKPRGVLYVLISAILIAPAFRIVMLVAFPDNHHLQYLLTPSRMDSIAWGGVCAVAVFTDERNRWIRKWSTWLGISGAGLIALTGLITSFERKDVALRVWGYSALGLAFGMVLLFVYAQQGTLKVSLLRSRMLCFAGKLCFGIYVLHRLGEAMLERLAVFDRLRIDSLGVEAFVVKVVFALLLAWCSWRFLERPFLNLKHNFA